MTFVVDASVVIKWALPERHAAEARRLLSSDEPFIAPALLPVELGNILWKKTRSGELTPRQATEALVQLSSSVRVEPETAAQLQAALHFAIRYDRTMYDSLYIVLALVEECPFVTADRRLYNAVAPTLPATMLWVEDIPIS